MVLFRKSGASKKWMGVIESSKGKREVRMAFHRSGEGRPRERGRPTKESRIALPLSHSGMRPPRSFPINGRGTHEEERGGAGPSRGSVAPDEKTGKK